MLTGGRMPRETYAVRGTCPRSHVTSGTTYLPPILLDPLILRLAETGGFRLADLAGLDAGAATA